jgi:hypothetical protein
LGTLRFTTFKTGGMDCRYVEPFFHVLAQRIIALILQEGGNGKSVW